MTFRCDFIHPLERTMWSINCWLFIRLTSVAVDACMYCGRLMKIIVVFKKNDKMGIVRAAFNVGFTDLSISTRHTCKKKVKVKTISCSTLQGIVTLKLPISIVMTTADSKVRSRRQSQSLRNPPLGPVQRRKCSVLQRAEDSYQRSVNQVRGKALP